MASLNPLTRELVFKIVFYGPGLGGKTTTLQYIHAATKPEHRGKMVSLATPMDRTLYFDFLPLRIPRVRGMGIRLQLFTVPGQVYYGATRKLVLTGADGVVFVADSQPGRMEANQESLEDLVANLIEHNRPLEQVSHTFHWNKRDLPDAVPFDELDRKFNRGGAPSLGTVATRGDGVFEGLEQITRLVIQAYEADLPKSERALETHYDSPDQGGIADAIRGLAESSERPAFKPAAPKPQSRPPADPPAELQRPDDVPAAKVPTDSARLASEPAEDDDVEEMPTVSLSGDPNPVRFGRRTVPLGPEMEREPPRPPAFSLAELWAEPERETAREAEQAIASREVARAVLACDMLVTRVLASAAGLLGSADAPRDPGSVALLLGLDGRRYLGFRAIVRAVRQSEEVHGRDALECYAFALEVRRAREWIGR
jgi:signal recognition particle receptor subunit beta